MSAVELLHDSGDGVELIDVKTTGNIVKIPMDDGKDNVQAECVIGDVDK